MSLLTDTQGTPERVWSSARAVTAAGGQLARSDLAALLNPKFLRNGEVREIEKAHTQAIGATVSLDLIALKDGIYTASIPLASDYGGFSDQVHDRLCALSFDDADYLILEGFAWMTLKIEQRQSMQWCSGSADAFAAEIEGDIGNPVGGTLRYNPTKITPWRRWIQFLDLAVELPGNLGLQPCVTGRLTRELTRSSLPRDTEIPVQDFLAATARLMPYLDGGALHAAVAGRMNVTTDRRKVSRLLSMALRDLAEADLIELRVRGDSASTVELASDDRPAVTVLGVVLKEGLR